MKREGINQLQKCRYCDCARINHSGQSGQGGCIHCRDCDRFRVTGMTRTEALDDRAKRRCEKEGHDWQQFDKEPFHCARCGIECPKCNCGANGTPDHTCPYAEEINHDTKSLCNCCANCWQECANDI